MALVCLLASALLTPPAPARPTPWPPTHLPRSTAESFHPPAPTRTRLPPPRSRAIRASLPPTHDEWMLYALRLAERGRLTTAPNPWVGCVIIGADGSTVLGEGWHVVKGGPHAEAAALADARERGMPREQMEGGTAYVTLEPCHAGVGKTTPPCDEALVASGLRRVHIALVDPDPTFGNAGVGHLREHGVDVTVGTAAAAVAASLRPYLHHRRTRLPYVVLKAAPSADGAIACADGSSQWITGGGARAHAQLLRASSRAILVGSGTALADEPRLTLRLDDTPVPPEWHTPAVGPLRVVLDGRGRVVSGPLLDPTLAPTLIFTTAAAPASSRRVWEAAGVEVCEVGAGPHGEGVSLEQVLVELGGRGVLQLMVEGGGALLGCFLAQRVAQQMRLYIGACVLGSDARRWIQAPIASSIEEAQRWKLLDVQRLGDDVCLDYLLPGGNVDP